LKAKIVLVRPKYGENVGLAARACANFGCRELALVRPECDFKSGKAKARAMHGQNVLLKAKIFDSIEEAVKDCSYVVCTSAKARKNRKALGLGEFAERFAGGRGKVGLVFGPEPSGLSAGEIDECDFVVGIEASGKYPTLNLSHAVCVVLYSLFSAGKDKRFSQAKPASKRKLVELFETSLGKSRGIQDKAMVLASFRALTARSLLSEKEAGALIAFFGRKK